MKLEQLSERSGVDVGTISALENRGSVRSKYAPAICKALGFTVEQLSDPNFDWTQAPPNNPAWPFENVGVHEYEQLSSDSKREIEQFVRFKIDQSLVAHEIKSIAESIVQANPRTLLDSKDVRKRAKREGVKDKT